MSLAQVWQKGFSFRREEAFERLCVNERRKRGTRREKGEEEVDDLEVVQLTERPFKNVLVL